MCVRLVFRRDSGQFWLSCEYNFRVEDVINCRGGLSVRIIIGDKCNDRVDRR